MCETWASWSDKCWTRLKHWKYNKSLQVFTSLYNVCQKWLSLFSQFSLGGSVTSVSNYLAKNTQTSLFLPIESNLWFNYFKKVLNVPFKIEAWHSKLVRNLIIAFTRTIQLHWFSNIVLFVHVSIWIREWNNLLSLTQCILFISLTLDCTLTLGCSFPLDSMYIPTKWAIRRCIIIGLYLLAHPIGCAFPVGSTY